MPRFVFTVVRHVARLAAACVMTLCAPVVQANVGATGSAGLQFECPGALRATAEREMRGLLEELHISQRLVVIDDDPAAQTLTYRLTSPGSIDGTLDFARQPQFWVYDDIVMLPGKDGRLRQVSTVSRKEVVLALMSAGRLSTFAGSHCSVAALLEHVQLRQHIVAWAQELAWGWPDGSSASWNSKLWDQGTPRSPKLTSAALLDALLHQSRYAVGCYTAAKLVYAGAIVDFYSRVHRDKRKLSKVMATLWSDQDPLVGVEPGAMWSFEPDYDPQLASTRPGKLLELAQDVSPRNFVPGDWAYFFNTDPASYAKTGYEGSNAIYLGRGRFSDYYNDNEHAYTFEQKLDEVYQWRHGVFSRSRHYDRAELLSPHALQELSKPPQAGGLLVPVRAVPRLW